ncbi:MAG: smpB [Bacteriovoracaceae bacterium]|nr:smpB [Bacteriovoracaceae bacterium]
MSEEKKKDNSITENKKARFNYSIAETFEAGLVLTGTEVKACRAKKVNLSDGYAAFRGGELYLQNIHISEYSHGNRSNHDPRRVRKLLLHAKELDKLIGLLKSGQTLVPLKMYFKNSFAKVLLGLAKGKKAHDKRQDLKEKEAKREIARSVTR